MILGYSSFTNGVLPMCISDRQHLIISEIEIRMDNQNLTFCKRKHRFIAFFMCIYATISAFGQTTSQDFTAGACIIDLGVQPQTTNNGLRPYGLVYELVKNKQIPVYWVINPDKTFVTPTAKTDQADFTVAGKTYYGGAFVIPSEFMPSAQTTVSQWLTAYPGLTIDCNRPAFSAPVHGIITSFPKAVLDAQNGDKAVTAFYTPSGTPASSYRANGAPSNLTACDGVYIMPHADPQNWNTLEKTTLDKFIKNGY